MYYVQSAQGKQKRIFYIEKIFEDVTFQNASDPRCPPMSYQDIKDYIESVLDANHIPSITPQIGMLLNAGDQAFQYDETQPGYEEEGGGRGRGRGGRGIRGRGRGGRGDRGGRGGGQGAGQGRGGGQGSGGRTDRAGRFPNDLARMKTASGVPICVNFQKARGCEKEVTNGSCGQGNSTRKHVCAVIIEMKPWQLCESEEHGASSCDLKI